VEVDDSVGVLSGFDTVGNEDNGGAGLMIIGEMCEDGACVVGVEVAGRLVGEDEAGAVEHGAGDGRSLLFAGAELCRVVAAAGGEAKLLDEFGCTTCRVWDVCGSGRQQDVFDDVEIWNEVKHLEDETDVFCAEAGPLGGGHSVEVPVVEEDCAACGTLHTGESHEEGGLAAAAGAANDDEFAGTDVEADIVEGIERFTGRTVCFGDVFETQHFIPS